MKNVKFQVVIAICFILAMFVMTPILLLCLEGGPWQVGTFGHTVVRAVWLSSMVVVAAIVAVKELFRGNLIGVVLLIVIGPITLLALIFYRVYINFTGGAYGT